MPAVDSELSTGRRRRTTPKFSPGMPPWSFGLHLEQADVPPAYLADQACAAEDRHRLLIRRREPDPA
jgi:hypothetical protein